MYLFQNFVLLKQLLNNNILVYIFLYLISILILNAGKFISLIYILKKINESTKTTKEKKNQIVEI